jgi:hypothetical protein
MRSFVRVAVFACVVVLAWQSVATAGVTYRKLAVTGDPAPGMSGSTFTAFEHPASISDAGVAFIGKAGGQTWIWADRGEGLQPAVRRREDLPGLSGTQTLIYMEDVIINDAGQVATRPMIGYDGYAVLVADPDGTIRVPVPPKAPAPGAEPSEFRIPSFPDLADNGQVCFQSSLSSPTGSGVWMSGGAPDESLGLIARRDGDAPSTGEQFQSIYSYPSVGGGRAVFRAELTDGNDSLWGYTPSGGLEPIAVQGQTAPNGETYSAFGEPRINDKGHVALLTGGDGILKETDDGLTVVAWRNGLAPGTGGNEFHILNRPVLNDLDQVAFRAYLYSTGLDDLGTEGIWSQGHSGQLHLVAREGAPAPGTDGTFSLPVGMTGVCLSDGGYTAFLARADANNGIWVEGSPGELELIALEGAEFTVAPGDVRTVNMVRFAAEAGSIVDGYALEHSINSRGELVFKLDFTDGSSGLFTATVPEPATLTLLALASLPVARRRRRNT